jgi:phosphoribosyl 1,2-cyclic phosphodiesterase
VRAKVLRFCCLGSGSGGNAYVVEASDHHGRVQILVDDGFSPRELQRRLSRAGVDGASLAAVFVTHEHSDHAAGVSAFARRCDLAVYCTEGTAREAGFASSVRRLHTLRAGTLVAIGPLQVCPIAVPHDAAEPVQFAFCDGESRLAIVTDLGHPAFDVIAHLSHLDALVLEFNHDLQMLRSGPYSDSLKARIESDVGHLSNDQSLQILGAIDRSRLTQLVAAHLSKTNNRPEVALAAIDRASLGPQVGIDLADQALGLDWRTVRRG